jgi:hypothetical protein
MQSASRGIGPASRCKAALRQPQHAFLSSNTFLSSDGFKVLIHESTNSYSWNLWHPAIIFQLSIQSQKFHENMLSWWVWSDVKASQWPFWGMTRARACNPQPWVAPEKNYICMNPTNNCHSLRPTSQWLCPCIREVHLVRKTHIECTSTSRPKIQYMCSFSRSK